MEERPRRRLLPKVIALLALPALVLLILAIVRVAPAPLIDVQSRFPGIGPRTPITVAVTEPTRGLGRVKVELQQGDSVHVLAEKVHQPRPFWAFWGPRDAQDEMHFDVGRATVPDLHSGEAVLRVTAERAGTWFRRPAAEILERKFPVRLQPPSLQATSSHVIVAQAGCEVVVYRVGQSSVRDGVRVGDWWFPGYALPGGGKQERFAFFAVPYDVSDAGTVTLEASDDVGNEAKAAFIERFQPRPFRNDTIQVDDVFLQRVVPEILSNTTGFPDHGDRLQDYLAINRDLRKQNGASLRELATHSKPEFLWREPFLPFPNAKVMSTFADRRTYIYQGKVIDHQDHLGLDLASVGHAPVPAANRGIVVLARFLGIYGNAVVVDHGYGLMSLYAHLSSLGVSEGQTVERGAVLGKSGATGLAGGDHLHFTMLLQGLPVTPIEWWDPHWLRDRLAAKLGAAMPFGH